MKTKVAFQIRKLLQRKDCMFSLLSSYILQLVVSASQMWLGMVGLGSYTEEFSVMEGKLQLS